MQTLNEAGILPVQNYPTLQLKGRNILIGFLDSGIDYTNPVFQNLDNTTRIRAIWDQTVQTGTMPEHFSYGSEFTEEQINEALRSDSPFDLVPSTDETGHGTYAAALACGSAVPEEGKKSAETKEDKRQKRRLPIVKILAFAILLFIVIYAASFVLLKAIKGEKEHSKTNHQIENTILQE